MIGCAQEEPDTKPTLSFENSQNGKFSYGYASSPGKRASMEDFYETRIDGVDGEIVGLFGVFDGASLSLSLSPTNCLDGSLHDLVVVLLHVTLCVKNVSSS